MCGTFSYQHQNELSILNITNKLILKVEEGKLSIIIGKRGKTRGDRDFKCTTRCHPVKRIILVTPD